MHDWEISKKNAFLARAAARPLRSVSQHAFFSAPNRHIFPPTNSIPLLSLYSTLICTLITLISLSILSQFSFHNSLPLISLTLTHTDWISLTLTLSHSLSPLSPFLSLSLSLSPLSLHSFPLLPLLTKSIRVIIIIPILFQKKHNI